MHLDKGACLGEGCYFGRAQAQKAVDLYESPGPLPVVVGRLLEGECADSIATEGRFAPLPGGMLADIELFKEGEVVHRLGKMGEGCFDVRSKGQTGVWCDKGSDDPIENGAVAWQKRASGDGCIRRAVGAGETREWIKRLAARTAGLQVHRAPG
ncbi:MAG: hypothetical protein ABL956_04050 [Hyphomonadaceae bacterium]